MRPPLRVVRGAERRPRRRRPRPTGVSFDRVWIRVVFRVCERIVRIERRWPGTRRWRRRRFKTRPRARGAPRRDAPRSSRAEARDDAHALRLPARTSRSRRFSGRCRIARGRSNLRVCAYDDRRPVCELSVARKGAHEAGHDSVSFGVVGVRRELAAGRAEDRDCVVLSRIFRDERVVLPARDCRATRASNCCVARVIIVTLHLRVLLFARGR